VVLKGSVLSERISPLRLGQAADIICGIHTVEDNSVLRTTRLPQRKAAGGKLLFPDDPFQVFVRNREEGLKLGNPLGAHITGVVGCAGFFQEPLGFLLVCPGNIEGVFEGGVMVQGLFNFHGSILLSFPGRFQRTGREKRSFLKQDQTVAASSGAPAAPSTEDAGAGKNGGLTPAISSMTRTTWQL